MKTSLNQSLIIAAAGCALLTACSALAPPPSPAELPKLWRQTNHDGLEALHRGDMRQAEKLLEESARYAEAFGEDDPRLAGTLNNLASVYDSENKYERAQELYRRALTIFESQSRPNNPAIPVIASNLARVLAARGEYQESAALYKKALLLRQRYLSPAHPDVAETMYSLAGVYLKQDKPAFAEPLLKQALNIDVAAHGRDNPETIEHLRTYAGVVRKLGRTEEADKLDAIAANLSSSPR